MVDMTQSNPHHIHFIANDEIDSMQATDKHCTATIQVQNQCNLHDQEKMLNSMKCSKTFSDAAWKFTKEPESDKQVTTGIGVHCQLQDLHCKAFVFVQASIPMTPSVLQAEAEALLFAAKIANILQIGHVAFLTDNIALAKAAKSSCLVQSQVPWEIRQQRAHFKSITKSFSHAVYHIKRDLNKEAHECAHQATKQAPFSPTLRCSNSSHRNSPCPIISRLLSLSLHGFVIHNVTCL
jgi:hypothetical protein